MSGPNWQDYNVLSCGLTYSAHPLGCAAGIATIEYYKEAGLIAQAKERGILLGKLLEDIKRKHSCVGDVRYIGLFSAIELVKNKQTKEPLVEYGQDPEKTMKKIIDMRNMNYKYFMPTRVIMGNDCIMNNRDVFKTLGEKALIVTGARSAKINGSEKDVKTALDSVGISYLVFDKEEYTA